MKGWLKEDRLIGDQIAALASRLEGGYAEMAVRLGISDRTLRTRRNRPETFTLLELRRLSDLAAKHQTRICVHLGGEG